MTALTILAALAAAWSTERLCVAWTDEARATRRRRQAATDRRRPTQIAVIGRLS